jgi:hypothetical protein
VSKHGVVTLSEALHHELVSLTINNRMYIEMTSMWPNNSLT